MKPLSVSHYEEILVDQVEQLERELEAAKQLLEEIRSQNQPIIFEIEDALL